VFGERVDLGFTGRIDQQAHFLFSTATLPCAPRIEVLVVKR
jgi:hypothetical protein